MLRCPSCSAEVPTGSAFCPGCGVALAGSLGATLRLDPAPASSARPLGEGRFAPGTLLAGRYRIVAPLGRGGMGEVYRAEDLKLHQSVALKFLPEALAADDAALARLHREVRLARHISHPNVCRVFDLGEAEGQGFLCMEYIDGENLETLLRRIGRLPPDKGVEIARQLAAGLAAIHEGGMLHRDLKPANLMIDGRGQARITDFGVATRAGDRGSKLTHAGTPAYMAPEQRLRGEVSVQSDLYGLGLVLYEMFSGRPPFPYETPVDTPPPRLSGLEPQVARIVLQCLEPDPARRPASAARVAAAFPGGDPLAVALAAGETPSPEAVVGAAQVGTLQPAVAAALLAGVLSGLLACLALSGFGLFSRIPLDRPPEALADQARRLLRELRPSGKAADSAYGFEYDGEVHQFLLAQGEAQSALAGARLASGRPPILRFWYRESPEPLVPGGFEVASDDPPLHRPGEALVLLDPEGRLSRLQVSPAAELPAPPAVPPASPAWPRLLAAAGFSPSLLTPAAPLAVPPVFADRRAAWVGPYPGPPGLAVRIEAAALQGSPVAFALQGPWSPAARPLGPEPQSVFVQGVLSYVLLGLVVVSALLLARHNLRLRRGDLPGARRFSLFVFAVVVLRWVATGQHVASRDELRLALAACGVALANAAFVWIFYLGLEPLLRRHWPGRIISWSRLVAGRFRDPLVGRDLLVGCLLGLGIALVTFGEQGAVDALHGPSAFSAVHVSLLAEAALTLAGPRGQLDEILYFLLISILVPSAYLVLLLLFRLVLGRDRWAIAAFALIHTTLLYLGNPGVQAPGISLLYAGLSTALTLAVLVRFGLLAGSAGVFVHYLLLAMPLTHHLSAWYAGPTLSALVLILALAAYGFATAVAGQPWFPRANVLDA